MLNLQSAVSASCQRDYLPMVSNGVGLAASAHYTDCADIERESAMYVYLRRAGEAESDRSLIFRYYDVLGVEPPKIDWIDKSTLQTSVAEVDQVTKMVDAAQGVKIIYSIGNERQPRESWKHQTNQLKLIAAFAFVFLLALIYGAIRIVASIRQGCSLERQSA